jgi:hypothetical protein
MSIFDFLVDFVGANVFKVSYNNWLENIPVRINKNKQIHGGYQINQILPANRRSGESGKSKTDHKSYKGLVEYYFVNIQFTK